jgi:xylulokinase
MTKQYLLGYDLGSSSIKTALIEAETGKLVASATEPSSEMLILSPHHGWAEQDPGVWWQNARLATHNLLKASGIKPSSIIGIGISYQMHGLVLVDKNQQVLRHSIIWCDSRAVEIGNQAQQQLGELYCLERLLNSPGNFTASKLKWVKDHEPDIYKQVHKAMLPGDYLAMRMTGEIATTISGLSEGMLWDYQKETLPERLLNYYGIEPGLIAEPVPTFSVQGKLTAKAAAELNLEAGTPVSYRAGDQPNNAFSLKTLHAGEIASTAGTSGVIYAVVDKPVADKLSRVNTFVHVNHTREENRFGVLLCVNGTGIMNSWLRRNLNMKGPLPEFTDLNALAAQAPIGADHLYVLPFGNGAERVLQNANIGASMHGLNLNRHTVSHVCRAAQEGIVFALKYGFEVLNELGIASTIIRAGNANMFLSTIFCETFANITDTELSLYNTDGAQGAARGAGVGIQYYANVDEAYGSLVSVRTYEPDQKKQMQYQDAYAHWKEILRKQLI